MPLMRCKRCGRYTLQETCPGCGSSTSKPYPPRFSPEDRYGSYRRRLKLEAMKGHG